MRFRFDTISFFLGMVVATVIWWVVTLSRPLLENLLEANRARKKDRELLASSNLEEAHRRIVYKQTQGLHMAASLFALDELAIEPRLLAPPAFIEPNSSQSHHPDIVDQALPYLRNYPEMGAVYGAPTLKIAEALSGDTNLVIIGQPGMGKTTALAHLASQIVNRSPKVQNLHIYIPFFIHAADLGLPLTNPQKPEDFLAPIAEKHVDHLPRHVERRQDDACHHQVMWDGRLAPMRGGVQDFLLAPCSGKQQRHTAECHHADCVGQERDWHEPS